MVAIDIKSDFDFEGKYSIFHIYMKVSNEEGY